MEPHAFDDLSRDLANGVSRRAILKTLAGACLYGFLGPMLGIREARAAQTCVSADIEACINKANDKFEREMEDCDQVARPAQCRAAARRRNAAALKACNPCPVGTRCESNVCCPNGQSTCAPPCSVTRTQQTQVNAYSKAFGQFLFTGSLTIDLSTKDALDRKVISRGRDTLVTVERHQSKSGGLSVVVDYGAPFTGIKHAVVNSADGNTFIGTVDGRRTLPYSAGADPISIRFEDGNASPILGSTEAGLIDKVTAVLKQAKTSVQTDCTPTPNTPNAIRPFDTFPGCELCDLKCGAEFYSCGLAAMSDSLLCGWFAPVCFVAQSASCIDAEISCGDACNAPGHACCPVFCPGNHCCGEGNVCCGPHQCCAAEACCGDFCCSVNQICVDRTNGICCAKNDGPVCGTNTCCPSGQFCADPAQQLCCSPGTRLCGMGCCPVDSLCLRSGCCGPNSKDCGDGKCCPNDAPCINGSCCQAPNTVCAGECCTAFPGCCNNVCCGTNDICMDNQICCPRDQVCGHICCPAGQHCVNGACAVCPQGTVPCSSPGPNGVIISICCPPGANCCLGVCCTNQTGHECTGVGGACGTIH